MGFQAYNSSGQELRSITGTAGGDLTGTYPNPTIATNAVTADKLAAALANSLGANQTSVTNRSAMTAMTTERSTSSTSYVDVTGGSLTFTVASGAYLIVGYNAQVKVGTASNTYWKVLAGSAICSPITPQAPGMTTGYVDGNVAASYVKIGGAAIFSAAEVGTGSQTFKWQFATAGGGSPSTAYINNCYLTVIQVTF